VLWLAGVWVGCCSLSFFLVPMDVCGAHGHGYLFCLSTGCCQIINGSKPLLMMRFTADRTNRTTYLHQVDYM